ncbi:MAG: TPM domain-containing protein [Dysgonomonas sp.]|nr:TPM domain-containing protein [Dysgonomonas sp.]
MQNFRKAIFFLFWVISISMQAQDIPEPMSPPRLVNDFAGIFSASQKDDLEKMLLAYNDSTSTQIYVVTLNDLQGYAASDYAFRLGEKWGVGQKEKNNGAVILIKPKVGNSRGDVFIAVGYGLEEKLNDARIGRIIDNNMLPYFRENDYYGGTRDAVLAMINYLSGQFQADEGEGEEITAGDVIFFILMIILFIYLMNKINKNNKGNGSRGGGFFPPIIGGGSGRGSRGGGFGGFGGGGGGSFGGGGAGRSW